MKRIGILGSGNVGRTLADGFIKHGYEVKIGTGNPDKLSEWLDNTGSQGSVGSFKEAAAFGDLVVLAVKGVVAEKLLGEVKAQISGKTIIDSTNPIADQAPEEGLVKFTTDLNHSLMETLQSAFPEANFVKAFNSVGAHLMVNPPFEVTPTMFIAGNNEASKKEVSHILDLFGYEVEDLGGAKSARAIEPLCILWCIPGFKQNEWGHAFKLLKK